MVSLDNALFQEEYLKIKNKLTVSAGQEESQKIIKILNLKKKAKILDLCCGYGRHSIPLAKMGYHVTGVDISDYLLNIAKNSGIGLPVTFINKDMRHIDFNKEFDAVINLSHSFGYFEDDKENYKVLAAIKRSLKPGGKFIIDVHSPGFIRRNFMPYSEHKSNGDTVIIKSRIDKDTVINDITIIGIDTIRQYEEKVKLYDLDWFKSMLKKISLIIDDIYGDFNKNPYNPLSSKNIIITGHLKKSLLDI